MEARVDEFKKYYNVEEYLALGEDVNAELINGEIVYMASASTRHQIPISKLSFKLNRFFEDSKMDCIVFNGPGYIILFEDINDIIRKTCVLEPDIFVICDESKLGDDGYHGAPPLVIEVTSDDRLKLDIGDKLFAYRDAGVKEYWIIEYEKQIVRVFDFTSENSDYVFKLYTIEDEITSILFRGFKIKVSSLFNINRNE